MKKILILFLMIFSFSLIQAQEEMNFTDANGLKQGYWEEKTGHILSKGLYEDNLKEGSWITYHHNGMVNSVINYRKGKKTGAAIYIDQRAYIKYEQNFKNDILHGEYKEYAPGGRLVTSVNYKNGQLHGEKKLYYDNGKIQEESFYIEGKKDGVAKWFTQQGQLVAEFRYKAGAFDGVQKAYFNSGGIMSETFYVNDKKEGQYKEYHENNTLKIEGQYQNDLKEGEWKEYDEEGKLIKMIVYKKGEVKKEKSYK